MEGWGIKPSFGCYTQGIFCLLMKLVLIPTQKRIRQTVREGSATKMIAPQQVSSSSDHHYTTLPFTNALGEPVCCVIIIAGETNSVLDTLGIDYCNMGADFLDKETTEEDSMSFFLKITLQAIKRYFLEDLFVALTGRRFLLMLPVLHLVVSHRRYLPIH